MTETTNGKDPTNIWGTGLRVLERYGFATVACLGIAWFANTAIEYEREKMGPALESNTKAIERNTEVFRQLPDILRKTAKAERLEAEEASK